MLSLLERDGLLHPVVVLFCSNNFTSIFDGIDVTHHRSLYSRFMKVTFKVCDHDEVVDYLQFYNDRLAGSPYHCDFDHDALSKTLRDDVAVTHRRLHHLSIDAKYNSVDTVRRLNGVSQHDLELDELSANRN